MSNFLRLAVWNANGLQSKKHDVEIFLKLHAIDILLISETHFTTRSYVRIPNYVIYHTEHPDGNAHGGTAIIIRQTIVHHELPKYEMDFLQATTVQVNKLNNPLIISAVYCPPRHNIKKQHLEPFFGSLGQTFITGGDFNAKHVSWGSRLTTTKGRELYALINENNYSTLSTGEPTYWPTDVNKIPDLLDFCITHGISSNYLDIQSNFDLTSDHTPIIVTISTTIIKKQSRLKLYSKNTDWELFKEHIRQNLNLDISMKTEEELEQATNYFITTIQTASWNATPPQANGSRTTPNIPREIMELIAEKRRARARWQYSHNPLDKTIFNRLANQLKSKIRDAKNESFQNYINNLSVKDNTLWKATKGFKRPRPVISPLRNSDGSWARSDSEKAQLFAQHLAEVF